MIKTWAELIERAKALKEGVSDNFKINASAMFAMVMAGVFDDLLESPPTVEQRKLMIYELRAALGSKALPFARKKKTDLIGMIEVNDEMSRKMWVTDNNPLFKFRIADEYTEAIKVMGYKDTGAPNLRWRQDKLDLFTNFDALLSNKSITYFSNRMVDRCPGIIGLYQGYSTEKWGDKTYVKVRIFDGMRVFEATVWPDRRTEAIEPRLLNAIKTYRNKPCIFLGRVRKNNRGYVNFNLDEIRLIG